MIQKRRQGTVDAFRDRFGRLPEQLAEAPGRVNLIGEHTDYHEGYVLPVAIDRTVLIAAAPSSSATSHLWAMDLQEESVFDPADLALSRDQPWSNYLRGVAWALAEAGYMLTPVDLAIQSTVPMGAGLSSSAALEVAATLALAGATGIALPSRDVAQIAHRAETGFVGVPCGIMDQYISALALEEHALLIDCRTLEATPVPLSLEQMGVAVVIVESGVRRELAHSGYGTRRQEGTEAMSLLRPWLPPEVRGLRDITTGQLTSLANRLPPVLYRRVMHVVAENDRVLRFVRAMGEHRLRDAGSLMVESHRSLRDDYEVSCSELDLLVDLALDSPGTLGARLTGAGFGGCTVNLIRNDAISLFQKRVAEEYSRQTGKSPCFHVTKAVGGARLCSL